MKIPQKIGHPEVLFRDWIKSAARQRYKDGNGREYGYVTFHADCGPAVVIYAVTKYNRVLAVREFRHGADAVMLNLPGGLIDEGEKPIQAAKRELLEETGYGGGKWQQLTRKPIYFDPASWDMGYIPILAQDCRKLSEPTEKSESEAVKMETSKWINAIVDGVVRDGKSIVTTFLATMD